MAGRGSVEKNPWKLQINSLEIWKVINSTCLDTLYILTISKLCCKALVLFQMLILANVYVQIGVDKGLTHLTPHTELFNSRTTQRSRYCFHSPFTYMDTKAGRYQVACSRSRRTGGCAEAATPADCNCKCLVTVRGCQ